jgi:hypothetical protein
MREVSRLSEELFGGQLQAYRDAVLSPRVAGRGDPGE